jgi:aryl sulfotransferase
VHDAYTLTPKGEPLLAGRGGADGAILIVRDPRDVVPSLASHNRTSIDNSIARLNMKNGAVCSRPNRMYEQFRQQNLDWSGHTQSWLDQTDIPVHLIRYEEMRADTLGTFRRALDFAGRAASEDEIRRAVAYADFGELRRQEAEKGFREAPPRAGGQFFRRGEAGAWRDELSVEQVARIEAAHAPMMQQLGYELASAPLQARRA